jgi:7-cyano-7-deazaguanine synthase
VGEVHPSKVKSAVSAPHRGEWTRQLAVRAALFDGSGSSTINRLQPIVFNCGNGRVFNPSAANDTLAVLFSGGLDSSILVAHLLGQGRQVVPVYVNSGLFWQQAELDSAGRFLTAIGTADLAAMAVLELPLADLYAQHWSITGAGVPQADDPDEAVYLPGRNPLLMVKAHVWCRLNRLEQLALGTLDTNPFADASEQFFSDFGASMDRAVGSRVRIVRPFAQLDKRAVMNLGRDFPLELTFSCLAPRSGLHCGRCNKCAERQRAFSLIELSDPTAYATAGQPLKSL